MQQKGIKESSHADYSFIDLTENSESEIRWVELHQMFDR